MSDYIEPPYQIAATQKIVSNTPVTALNDFRTHDRLIDRMSIEVSILVNSLTNDMPAALAFTTTSNNNTVIVPLTYYGNMSPNINDTVTGYGMYEPSIPLFVRNSENLSVDTRPTTPFPNIVTLTMTIALRYVNYDRIPPNRIFQP